MVSVSEYLNTSQGTEGSLLIVKKIYDKLITSAEKKRIGRGDAALIFGPKNIEASSIDVDLETRDSLGVRKIAEGAAIPIDVAVYTSFNMKPVKYGVRPLITKEMMEDAKWPMLERSIMMAGEQMALNEDGLIVTDALDNAGNTVSGGASATIANITRAMQYLEDSDYQANTMYVGPEFLNDLRNIDTFVEADKLGSREMLGTGFVGTIYGMSVKLISGNIMDTKYAYVFDKRYAFVMAEKRPVTVERYNDAIHDMSGAVVTNRIKVRQLYASAIAKITTS